MELRLSDLRDGESGIITSVGVSLGKGREDGQRKRHRMRRPFHRFPRRGREFRKRLEDMGLTPGTEVTVVRSVPLRGPLEVSVRGSRLALGRGMAERIFVEVKR